ncbi:hypothetical protein MPLB_130034 [Mesorhizobium sp. ORS 3324]|nr:hypothetical protein MPLB_130034 [Mesorhizobium sp. ORS 3324]
MAHTAPMSNSGGRVRSSILAGFIIFLVRSRDLTTSLVSTLLRIIVSHPLRVELRRCDPCRAVPVTMRSVRTGANADFCSIQGPGFERRRAG